jgi:4-amino-4-deoxy-L-arabinose transferase-like glycosyltransferase
MLNFLLHLFNKATKSQLVSFWLFFCFLTLTYNLDMVPPYHSDENYYVESTRNMIESGDYLTPVYRNEKRFAKPILYYWLQAASYKVFGVNLVSARLTSAFFGCLSIGLIFLFARRLFDGDVALYSALILPASYLHFQVSRWATTDIVMSFFVLLTFYYFLRLYQGNFKSQKDAYMFYLAMALGFMTKGPPAIIIPSVVVFIFLLAIRSGAVLSQMRIKQGFMILSVVIIPWFATMLHLHGDEFVNHIVGEEIQHRLVHDTPFSLYYFEVLIRYYLPWILFLLVAFGHQIGLSNYSEVSGVWDYLSRIPINIQAHGKLLFAKENQPILLCYIWILVCLILFTLVRTEHSRYMLPASPAIAILVAKYFADMEKEGFSGRGYQTASVLTGAIFVAISVTSGVVLYGLSIIYYTPPYFFLLPGLFFLAGVSVLRLNKKCQYGSQLFIISITLVLAFSFLSGKVLPHVNRYPMKVFSEKILSDKINDPIAVYRLGNQRAKLGVLTGKTSYNLDQPIQIKQFMDSGDKVLVVIREKDFLKDFSDTSFKIIAEDIAWLKGGNAWKKFKELWRGKEHSDLAGLTEKIYLLSNR